MSLHDAASSGDRRATLEAARDVIAARIDEGVSARDLAPLIGRLEVITAALDEMAAPDERSAADDLAAKRAARRGGADASSARRTTG